LTRAVHGEAGLESARKASAVLFGGSLEGLTAADLEGIASDVPSAELAKETVAAQSVMDVVTACGFVKSKSEARRLIQGGGLSINNIKVTDVNAAVTDEQLIEGKVLLLRQGKKNYFLLRVK
jgi:tyrosyl-tRNA synthetase